MPKKHFVTKWDLQIFANLMMSPRHFLHMLMNCLRKCWMSSIFRKIHEKTISEGGCKYLQFDCVVRIQSIFWQIVTKLKVYSNENVASVASNNTNLWISYTSAYTCRKQTDMIKKCNWSTENFEDYKFLQLANSLLFQKNVVLIIMYV